MATRRKKAKVTVKKNYVQGATSAAVRAGTGFAMGAAIGAAEELIDENAGQYVAAGLTVGGVLAEMFVDEEKNPYLARMGREGLTTGTSAAGRDVTKMGIAYLKDKNKERQLDQTRRDVLEAIRSQQIDAVELDELPAVAEVVPVISSKRRQKASGE